MGSVNAESCVSGPLIDLPHRNAPSLTDPFLRCPAEATAVHNDSGPVKIHGVPGQRSRRTRIDAILD